MKIPAFKLTNMKPQMLFERTVVFKGPFPEGPYVSLGIRGIPRLNVAPTSELLCSPENWEAKRYAKPTTSGC